MRRFLARWAVNLLVVGVCWLIAGLVLSPFIIVGIIDGHLEPLLGWLVTGAAMIPISGLWSLHD